MAYVGHAGSTGSIQQKSVKMKKKKSIFLQPFGQINLFFFF